MASPLIQSLFFYLPSPEGCPTLKLALWFLLSWRRLTPKNYPESLLGSQVTGKFSVVTYWGSQTRKEQGLTAHLHLRAKDMHECAELQRRQRPLSLSPWTLKCDYTAAVIWNGTTANKRTTGRNKPELIPMGMKPVFYFGLVTKATSSSIPPYLYLGVWCWGDFWFLPLFHYLQNDLPYQQK